jgi:hypothetical protein
MLGICHLSATDPDHSVAAPEIEGYLKPYAGNGTVAKTGEGTDSLGGRAFSYEEYKSTDSSAGDFRARFYATSLGRWRFAAILIYDAISSQSLVADLESALATLDFPAVAVRALPPGPRPADKAAIHDVLGRLRAVPVRTAQFRAPLGL